MAWLGTGAAKLISVEGRARVGGGGLLLAHPGSRRESPLPGSGNTHAPAALMCAERSGVAAGGVVGTRRRARDQLGEDGGGGHASAEGEGDAHHSALATSTPQAWLLGVHSRAHPRADAPGTGTGTRHRHRHRQAGGETRTATCTRTSCTRETPPEPPLRLQPGGALGPDGPERGGKQRRRGRAGVLQWANSNNERTMRTKLFHSHPPA